MRYDERLAHARPGIEQLIVLARMTEDEARAMWASMDARAIARWHAGAMCVLTIIHSVIRPNLNRESRARFTSKGSDAVRDAVRALAAEHPEHDRMMAELRDNTDALLSAEEWRVRLDEAEARFENAMREAMAQKQRLDVLVADQERALNEMRDVMRAYNARRVRLTARGGAPIMAVGAVLDAEPVTAAPTPRTHYTDFGVDARVPHDLDVLTQGE